MTTTWEDEKDEKKIIISHRVDGSDYGANNETADNVIVTIIDNDEEGVTITPTKLRFLEGERLSTKWCFIPSQALAKR